MAKAVTLIPATIGLSSRQPTAFVKKRRVAGYARVSTDKDEQFTSYEAQVDYYTNFILSHEDWTFVRIYTDEGISGLDTRKRDGFNQMVADALDGKIDLIVTKSISRFARNTVDSLTTIRALKKAGCECFFEKENIYTFDGKGELMLTILSSLAQEESRSISENVTWGQRKRFADGKVSLPHKHFLGYEKGPDGQPQVVKAEAEIVRRIYREFMQGRTAGKIAKRLTEDGIPTPGGKKEWRATTVESILTNEKYKGSALLQKQFTVDFLTKQKKVNEGEVPQYYVEESHEAIIAPEEWEAVQVEFNRRRTLGRNYSGMNLFASYLVCGNCGSHFGPKVWHSTSKYRTVIMRCNRKYGNEQPCPTPHFREEDIKRRFLAAWNELGFSKDEQMENCRLVMDVLTDTSELDERIAEVLTELAEVTALTQRWVEQNARTVQNQDFFDAKYGDYIRKYDVLDEKRKKLQAERSARIKKAEGIGGLMFELSELGAPVLEFDEHLFRISIEQIVALNDGRLMFCFKNGTKITE